MGGMFFVGPLLPVGQAVEFALDLSELGKVKALGEVRYHHAYPEGNGMGVRFTRLAQDDLSRISRYVDEHDRSHSH